MPPRGRVELERLVRRWHELPLDRALRAVPAVREVAQRHADLAADAQGRPRTPLPDLGPAVLLDQLVVTTYDLAALEESEPREQDDLVDRLAELRRRLGRA